MPKTIRARLDVPSILGKMGRKPSDGLPVLALLMYVDHVRAALTDSAELESCTVYGTEHLRFEYDNVLTPVEELTLHIAELQARRNDLRNMLPPSGVAMSPDMVEQFRQLLG